MMPGRPPKDNTTKLSTGAFPRGNDFNQTCSTARCRHGCRHECDAEHLKLSVPAHTSSTLPPHVTSTPTTATAFQLAVAAAGGHSLRQPTALRSSALSHCDLFRTVRSRLSRTRRRACPAAAP